MDIDTGLVRVFDFVSEYAPPEERNDDIPNRCYGSG